jgi:hypothetical protein
LGSTRDTVVIRGALPFLRTISGSAMHFDRSLVLTFLNLVVMLSFCLLDPGWMMSTVFGSFALAKMAGPPGMD